jgi:uncharacterized membrane protein YkoI
MRNFSILLAGLLLLLGPVAGHAFDLEDALREVQGRAPDSSGSAADLRTTQGNGGKSLSEAISQVRRQTGGQILSAETRVSGNREVHHIKVLTKDGKVKTVKVQGRRRDR